MTVMGCLKGGSTKTTTTNYLAFVRAKRRQRQTGKGKSLPVKVIDADTVSQTSYGWFKEAKEEGYDYPLDVERYPFEDLGDYLAELRQDGYDVFVDVGGGNVGLLHKALTQANRLVVPLSPSKFDTMRVIPTFEEVAKVYEENVHGGFRTHVLLSAKMSDKQAREARDRMEPMRFLGEPLPVLDTEIKEFIEYTRALGTVPTNLDAYTTVWDEMMRREAALRAGTVEVVG